MLRAALLHPLTISLSLFLCHNSLVVAGRGLSITCYIMQTNVHIDTKNLKPSPEHRIKGSGYSKRTIEVSVRDD